MSKTIILIDDDPDDLELMVEAIGEVDNSFTCVTYTNPEEAMQYLLKGSADQPSHIFIDINMPKMTGDICLTMLRESPHYSQVPIAMISTSMSNYVSKDFTDLGANFTLEKPNKMQGYYDMLHTIFSNK